MALEDLDFEADAAAASTNAAKAAEVGRIAIKLARLMQKQMSCANELAALNRDIDEIERRTLPDAMTELNVKEFPITEDLIAKVEDVIASSVPKGNVVKYAAMLAWMRANGHEDLIKSEVIIPIDKGKDNVAGQIMEHVEREYGITAERDSAIHPSTLSSWVREMIANGKTIPEETFGVFRGRVAKLVAPKKAKTKQAKPSKRS